MPFWEEAVNKVLIVPLKLVHKPINLSANLFKGGGLEVYRYLMFSRY